MSDLCLSLSARAALAPGPGYPRPKSLQIHSLPAAETPNPSVPEEAVWQQRFAKTASKTLLATAANTSWTVHFQSTLGEAGRLATLLRIHNPCIACSWRRIFGSWPTGAACHFQTGLYVRETAREPQSLSLIRSNILGALSA